MVIEEPILRQFSRMPPHDAEAEVATLGSLILSESDERFLAIKAKVRRDDFFQADNQIIFDALCRLNDQGKPIDAVTLHDELRKSNLLEEVGGVGYLATVMGSMPSAAHGEHYAAIVREKSVLRQGISAANDLLRDCYSAGGRSQDAAALLRKTAETLWQVAATGSADNFVKLYEAATASLVQKQSGDVPRISTGIFGIDELCRGIPRGKFTLVGGRPGMGKSLLCKQIALNVACRQETVGIVTVEEDRNKIADNMTSNMSNVENWRVCYNKMEGADWSQAMEAVHKMRGLPFWINDQAAKKSEVEEAVTTAVVKHGAKLVVVDYLQLISPDEDGENENREITKISNSLKRLAKRLDIGLIAACQLNRGNEHTGAQPPNLKNLRGSGSLEQDGDLIILLHRPEYYLTDEDRAAHPELHGYLEAIVAKNKDGKLATVPLSFQSDYQRITDLGEAPPTF